MNNELSNLNVYYGWSILNKIRRKVALSVIFENEQTFSERKNITIRRLQKTCYVRKQTISEAEDGKRINRTLTEHSLFLNQKPFNGDLKKLLDTNYQADINNVPEDILIEIKEALRKGFKSAYFQHVKS